MLKLNQYWPFVLENHVSVSKYDVVLVDVDPAYKSKLMVLLTETKPYPQLSRQKSARVIVNIPSVVIHSIDIKEAILLETLIEIAGGSVEIRPTRQQN